jgi:hypothetical protein
VLSTSSPLPEIISQFSRGSIGFRDVLKADPRIVQKDEIAIIRSMWRGITHKRDVEVALLPDCGALSEARN